MSKLPVRQTVRNASRQHRRSQATAAVPLATGGGSNFGNRWGDYSATRVDPSDGCTFWYTTEYVAVTGQRTHVGAVRFAACGQQFAAFNAVLTEYPNWPGFSINSN